MNRVLKSEVITGRIDKKPSIHTKTKHYFPLQSLKSGFDTWRCTRNTGMTMARFS